MMNSQRTGSAAGGQRISWKLVVCISFLAALFLIAIFAPILAPNDPYLQFLDARLIPPGGISPNGTWHLLGTDHLGRDYLSRLIYGSRVTLLIGFVVVIIAGFIGTVIGICAGYFGGWLDQALMFVINARLALPIVLAFLAVVVVFGPSLQSTIIALGVLLWDRFAVVVRSATQQIRQQEYILAAKGLGMSELSILIKEVLPNLAPAIAVVATIEMGGAILLESSLSFLGFGVQEPTPSWGLMLAQAKEQIFFDSWLIYIPGLAILSVVLAVNTLGDNLSSHFESEARP